MNQKKHNHKITDHNTELENRILNYILLFMTCAFLGWIWEVMLHLIQHGQFVNRGVLHGPWLPIYGFGGLGIVLLLERFKKHPLLVFIAGAIGCDLMEYLTGWYLETFKHLKWWDYGDAFLSINGRICFLSVTCFGLCALAIIYYLYPLLTRVYNYLKLRPKKILCFALTLFFLADFVYSSDCPNIGEGITDNLSYYSNYKSEEIT